MSRSRTRAAAATLAAAVLALGACSDDPTGPVIQVIEEVTFDASLGIDLAEYTEQPSGVWIRDLTVGTGAVIESGSTVTLDYTGWLTDATVFDSRTLGPFTYLGSGPNDRFIPGFEYGLEGVAEGGVRRMLIPPDLGFGPQDYGVIPGGSVIIFEVTLTSITGP